MKGEISSICRRKPRLLLAGNGCRVTARECFWDRGRLAKSLAESGIHTRADVERLEACGAKAILVGTALMRQPDIAAKVTELVG